MGQKSQRNFRAASVCTLLLVLWSLKPTAHAARPLGIDTSHWDGTVNWTSVYNAGYVFAFTKASEGTNPNYNDATLDINITNARAAGVVIGPYHFARPNDNTATAEANWFVSIAGKYMTNTYLRPVLDLEDGYQLGKSALSTWVNAFCNRVQTLTGVAPIVYTSPNYAVNYLNTTVTNWPLWNAWWPYFPDAQNGQPYTNGVWPTWVFWQYSATGHVAGVTTACDEDVFNGTRAQLTNYIIGRVIRPSITQQPGNRSIGVGGSATFSITAQGINPLGYQWQKNNTNLNNGGHYSGCTNNALVVSSADATDVASYRCIVSHVYGTSNSASATLTVTNLNIPPSFTLLPTNQYAAAGGIASFSVAVSGSSPFSYRWQKNATNLYDGGHHSGCATNTLIISSADDTDVANYRCVVTNNYGATNSTSASLTVLIPNPCLAIPNGDFESGFALAGGGYIANNWTEWETDPGVIVGYDEPDIVHGGAHSQRIRVSGGANGSSGGVYQRVPVIAGQPYLIGVWIYAGDSDSACSMGVDPAGGTNPASGVTWSSVTTNVAWVQATWAGIATANYLTVYLKVASTDSNKRNGYFDDAGSDGSAEGLQLTVERTSDSLTLSWPQCPASQLERADSLDAPVTWTAVTNQATVIGGQKSVTLSPTGSAGYFRLVLE
jgi:GH25 family lysozyme M1 (1,4-beta-N-acetylmuramidase)